VLIMYKTDHCQQHTSIECRPTERERERVIFCYCLIMNIILIEHCIRNL
jgi:hypothetical protein